MLKWLALLCVLAVPAYAGSCPDGSDPAEDFSCPGDEMIGLDEESHLIDGYEWRTLTPEEIDRLAKLRDYKKAVVPPARFDAFNPKARAIGVPPDLVSIVCNAMKAQPSEKPSEVFACEVYRDKVCIIVIPNQGPNIAGLIRHEMGHCNGWPADHPP